MKITRQLLTIVLTLTSLAAQANQVTPPTMKLGEPLPANIFVELAKAINPAVVNIATTLRPRRMQVPPGYDPFFDFFEQFMGPQGGQREMGPKIQPVGTGFVIDPDGVIVTNNHVVAEISDIKVQFIGDKKYYDAKLLGRDDRSDIAVIKISAGRKLPALALGSSEKTEVGEWVAAFGNPFGHTHSMSKGIISAKGRAIKEINRFPFLQTDASINPGNSGGPLVNMKGEVIGVNAAIDARAQGIGFAIPIDDVKDLIPQLKEKGRIARSFLGVGLAQYVPPQAARELDLPTTKGALVAGVEPGSPAEKAGIEQYDLITKVGDQEISNPDELRLAIQDTPVGSTSKIELFRGSKKKVVNVLFQDSPDAPKKRLAEKPKPAVQEENAPELGFNVAKLTPALTKEFNIDAPKGGTVVVTAVEPQGPAFRAGLQPGDLVLEVNKGAVKDPGDVKRNLKQGLNTLRIRRADFTTLVFIETR